MDYAERFAKYVDESGPCWLWTGGVNHQGYGKFWFLGRTVQAHRWVYEQVIGPIGAGLTIDHRCGTRRCVLPWHLEAVTMQENLLRSPNRPEKRTQCPRGHPYEGVNLYLQKSKGYVERRCRICQNNRSREYMRARARAKREVAA